MRYNELGKTGVMISEVGLGCEHLQGMEYDAVKPVIDAAIECGINIFDVFMSEPNVRSNIGKALKGRREKVMIQGHLCAIWKDGQYTRSRNIEEVKEYFEDLLVRLDTDYLDFGMIHYVDDMEDFEKVFSSEVIEYAKELKKQGRIRYIGMSSHNPQVALKAVKTGLIDLILFSINPAYDLLSNMATIDDLFDSKSYEESKLSGIDDTRRSLYNTCEAMGVGITVMKSLGAGSLLNKESSPFGEAMSVGQCIRYALDRPAAASVLVGCKTAQEVKAAAEYCELDPKETDYSVVLGSTPKYSLNGKCMYCNHCLPCPSHIDIAMVNKLLDLALMGEEDSVQDHYRQLKANASQCIACGSCEKNCPFGVEVIERMKLAIKVFSK